MAESPWETTELPVLLLRAAAKVLFCFYAYTSLGNKADGHSELCWDFEAKSDARSYDGLRIEV